MRIATWNINSVRLRIHHVLRFIKEQNIDVMCLQETNPFLEIINIEVKQNINQVSFHRKDEKLKDIIKRIESSI